MATPKLQHMLLPTQEAIGAFMSRFFAGLVPTTEDMREFVVRPLPKAIAWASGRMVDDAEKMLSAWQANDTDESPSRPYRMPAILVGMGMDYQQTSREANYQISEPIHIRLPEDPKSRVFKLRTATADRRMQVVVMAHERPTADAIVAQLSQFISAVSNRRFYARYSFAGVDAGWWPIMFELPDTIGSNVRHGAKSPVILLADFVLRTTVPLFMAPKLGEPNDGKGIPDTDDPAGYPVVLEVQGIDETIGMHWTVNDGNPP